ncbi:signal peptidase II [Devosia sp.]|uniref:signal peptidase II n=1 Tax=Devosia sp. TaxID=1871048 RepID=UPI003F6F612B
MSWGRGPILLALAIVPVDYFSKELARHYLAAEPTALLPVLDLSLSFNMGISFGLFASEGTWGWMSLIVLALLVMGVVAGLGHRASHPLERAGYATIMGGATGNLCDRFPDMAVTDFIDVHAGGWHFPTFNLADVAISIGVGLLLWTALMSKAVTAREPQKPVDPPAGGRGISCQTATPALGSRVREKDPAQ